MYFFIIIFFPIIILCFIIDDIKKRMKEKMREERIFAYKVPKELLRVVGSQNIDCEFPWHIDLYTKARRKRAYEALEKSMIQASSAHTYKTFVANYEKAGRILASFLYCFRNSSLFKKEVFLKTNAVSDDITDDFFDDLTSKATIFPKLRNDYLINSLQYCYQKENTLSTERAKMNVYRKYIQELVANKCVFEDMPEFKASIQKAKDAIDRICFKQGTISSEPFVYGDEDLLN